MQSDHTCHDVNHHDHDQATQDVIVNHIHAKIQEQSTYRSSNICNDIQRELEVQITYIKAWRAKEKAFESINDDFESVYDLLSKYCEKIRDTNFHSVTVLKTNESRFHRIFICFNALAVEFQYCRPVIDLDETHLKNKYQGNKSACILTPE